MTQERYECMKCGTIHEDKGKAEKHMIDEHFDLDFVVFYDENDL